MYDKLEDYDEQDLWELYSPAKFKFSKLERARFHEELQKNHDEICESTGRDWVEFLKSRDYGRLEAAVCFFVAWVKI